MSFGLSADEFEVLNQLAFLPMKTQGLRVWVFGSRARGDYKKFSDIDVMYEIPKGIKVPGDFFFHLEDSLENSNFPFKVDLVNRQELAASYTANIEKDKIEI